MQIDVVVRVYLRLLSAFIALGMLAVSGVGVYYIWEQLIFPEKELERKIVEIRSRKKEKVDYGEQTYREAVALLSTGALRGGVERLHELMKFYPDSQYYPEAKRVVGEINVDRLLSKSLTPGKHEYIVKGGDSLLRIAQDKQSTVGYVIHVNGRMGGGLQKGEQLVVSPLNFSILISLSTRTLTLRTEEGNFFKEYNVVRYKTPPNSPSQFDTKVKSLVVGSGDVLLPVGSARYVSAKKELRCERRAVPIRSIPPDSVESKYTTGFFLSSEDLEELVLLVRPGMDVHVRK